MATVHPLRRLTAFIALALPIAFPPQPARAALTVPWTTNGVALCAAVGNQQNPQIVADGAGGAIVTWQDARTGVNDIYAQRVRADGTRAPGWPTNGIALCTAAFSQTNPQLVPDGAGGAIVTWTDGRASGISHIYAQHVLAGGTADPGWTANGVAVCTAAGSQGLPQIVADGAGGAIVAWQDTRNGTSDIYAQHVRADGTMDPGWPADGRALCTAPKVQSNAQLVSDGAGGAIAAWHDSRSSGAAADIYDIYAQRVRADGAIAPGWPANGVALCTAISSQLFPAIASDAAGGAIVTWYDRRDGQPIDPIFQDIYAQRVSGAGQPLWTTDGVALCTAVSTQANPRIVPDGSGGAIVVWQDHRAGTYDLYAQHVLPGGAMDPAWPADGAAVCTAAGSQENPQIVSDGAGGALVTWLNINSGPFATYEDIYAQRVLAGGTVDPAWPVDGVALCSADSTQENPQIAPDGAGGAIVTWQDERRGGTSPVDIYAQRVTDSPCVTGGSPPAPSCAAVDWGNAAGGLFSDATNWNQGAGPVPAGFCPASCLPYDARFAVGGATYGVRFAGSPSSGVVTVDAGDHCGFALGGNAYHASELHVDGAGSSLTISGGAVAVDGAIGLGPLAGSARVAAAGGGASAFLLADGPGVALLTRGGAADSIVLEPGAALSGAAPLACDLANGGELSPGAVTDGAGLLEVGGDYTQTTGGTLALDLGGDAPGAGYDALRVTGSATLKGTLTWKLVGGYRPAIGKEFEVLVAHPRIGVFDSVAIDIGVSYSDTSVVLIATTATPVLASLVSAEAEPGRVRVRWQVSAAGVVTIRRDRGTGGWEPVATRLPDGAGMVEYEDSDVTSGRYGYRLGLPSGTGEITAGEVWVTVPVLSRFGLRGASPNPAPGPLTVSFSLGSAEPARLELYDLAGRRLTSRAIDDPRPGERVLALGSRDLPAGVYLLRLSQGPLRAEARVAVVR